MTFCRTIKSLAVADEKAPGAQRIGPETTIGPFDDP